MADPKDEKEVAAPAGPKKILGLPLLTFIFVAVNVLVMAGGVGYITWASLLYKKPRITNEQVVKEEIKKVEKPEVTAGIFTETYPESTITLRGTQGGRLRYVTVETVLLCPTAVCLDQVKANKAKVEDAIQSSLSSRSYQELGTLEVKFRVKHEVLSKVNSFLTNTAVTDILFTTFLVQ